MEAPPPDPRISPMPLQHFLLARFIVTGDFAWLKDKVEKIEH